MQHSILIVDDSKTVHTALTSVLHENGYAEVYHSYNTPCTMKVLELHTISLILMDIKLPDTNGIELTKILKKIESYASIPVIIITSDNHKSIIDKAFQAGAIDFLHKPFHKIEILARIRSALTLFDETNLRKEREEELLKREKELVEINRLLEIANQSYLRASAIDELTGLTNRRFFNQYLTNEFTNSHRKGKPFSLILIDIDYFKLYNDTYGHQAGDTCLKQVAQTIEKNLTNPKDIAARIGGEEFAVIAPDSSLDIAETIAERLRAAVMKLAIPHKGSENSDIVTISLGLANTVESDIQNENDLMKQADINLYKSKETGRNRTT